MMNRCLVSGCTCEGTHFVAIDRRGGRNGYLCNFHYRSNESYGTRNNNVVGTSKVNGIGIGVEFESSYADEKARAEFSAMGYLPTRDGSLYDRNGRGREVEFVSPTNNGFNKLSKEAVSFEKLMRGGHLEANDTCGTHLHVSTDGTRDNRGTDYGMDCVRRFYNSLFVPVSDVMYRNPEATEALFGRFFTDYAPMINMNTRQVEGHNQTRYAWVNCTNSNRIEYRLVKFVTAKQYQTVVKACIKMTQTVDKNFIQNFNKDYDKSRYNNRKEYRLHKAQVTANKLIKIYKDACKELGYEVM